MTQRHWRNLETEAELPESWHVTTFAVDCSEALSCCMLLLVGFSAIFPLCILLVDKDNFIHWQTISVLSFPSSIVFKSSNFFFRIKWVKVCSYWAEGAFVQNLWLNSELSRNGGSFSNFPSVCLLCPPFTVHLILSEYTISEIFHSALMLHTLHNCASL